MIVFPSECGLRGGNIKIDGLSAAANYSGCTVLKGNVKIELRAGPSKPVNFLKDTF